MKIQSGIRLGPFILQPATPTWNSGRLRSICVKTTALPVGIWHVTALYGADGRVLRVPLLLRAVLALTKFLLWIEAQSSNHASSDLPGHEIRGHSLPENTSVK